MTMLKNKIIGLDFGHGGKDSGALGFGKKEKDFNLEIGKLVANNPMLKECKIVLSRDSDIYVSLEKRVEIFKANKCDIVISIHGNSFTNSNVSGLETLTKGGYRGKILANTIQDSIMELGLFRDRKVKVRDNLYILNNLHRANIPCALIEIGFISNYGDNKTMHTRQKEISESIVKAIYKFYKVDYNKSLLDVKNVNNKFYRVISGSYTDRENAEKMVLELKEKGINSFIDIYYKR